MENRSSTDSTRYARASSAAGSASPNVRSNDDSIECSPGTCMPTSRVTASSSATVAGAGGAGSAPRSLRRHPPPGSSRRGRRSGRTGGRPRRPAAATSPTLAEPLDARRRRPARRRRVARRPTADTCECRRARSRARVDRRSRPGGGTSPAPSSGVVPSAARWSSASSARCMPWTATRPNGSRRATSGSVCNGLASPERLDERRLCHRVDLHRGSGSTEIGLATSGGAEPDVRGSRTARGRPGSERSCLSLPAAFWACFHARTTASEAGSWMSAMVRGRSSPNAPAAASQPSGRIPNRLASRAMKIRDFSSPKPGSVRRRRYRSSPPSTSRQMRSALPRWFSVREVQSAWMRRAITAGKRWMAGFAQHTATRSSTGIAAIRLASRWPSRLLIVAGPVNAHSIGTCWSSSIPIIKRQTVAVQQPVGHGVPGDEEVAGHAADCTAGPVRPNGPIGRARGGTWHSGLGRSTRWLRPLLVRAVGESEVLLGRFCDVARPVLERCPLG